MLGDDVAHGTTPGKQVQAFDIVLLARFYRNLPGIHSAMLDQKIHDIFGMNKISTALVFAGPLDLDQTDRPDIVTGVGFILAGDFLQRVAFFDAGQHRILPACAFLIVDMQVQLDHFLALQLHAFDVHQHITRFRGCGGKLHDHGWIQPAQCVLRSLAVCLVSLVQNDDR